MIVYQAAMCWDKLRQHRSLWFVLRRLVFYINQDTAGDMTGTIGGEYYYVRDVRGPCTSQMGSCHLSAYWHSWFHQIDPRLCQPAGQFAA